MVSEDVVFRWNRQKFVMSLTVALMSMTMIAMLFFLYNKQRLEIAEFTNETVKKIVDDVEGFDNRLKLLEEKIVLLSTKLEATESLTESLIENQKAQQALIAELSKRGETK